MAFALKVFTVLIARLINCKTDCLFADLEFDDEDYSTPTKKPRLETGPKEDIDTENEDE